MATMQYSTPNRNKYNRQQPTLPTSELDASPTSVAKYQHNSGPTGLYSNSIGSQWTVEMTTLKHSGSFFEAVQCLRRIRELLSNVDRSDRLKFCKGDYENATRILRKNKHVWSTDVFKEVVSIAIDFFNIETFRKLPVTMIQEILRFVPISEYCNVMQVSSDWHGIATANDLWQQLYFEKFLINNPGSLPTAMCNETGMMLAYQRRINDPEIGDKVEVAWRGKFRLETQDVYQGLAWWVAEVVDKHPAQERYKIRYPGWESRWDEWVPRTRLRWAVRANTLVSINVGDVVELWCCGANVPGAWLESKVKRTRGGRYCLGRVLSTGYLWVERDRLRLVRRPSEQQDSDAEGRPSSQRRRSLSMSLSSLSGRIQAAASRRRNQSCSIM